MDIQTLREFIAHGKISRGSVSIPVTIVGKYPSHGLGSVQCKIVVETPNLPSDFGDPFDYQKPIQLEGKTEGGYDIWSPDIRLTKVSGGIVQESLVEYYLSMEGIATLFIEGKLGNFNWLMATLGAYCPLAPQKERNT